MAFEQKTRQQHIEELEQLQKQKENERIQQELDLAIARIENEQIQRDLDAAIEHLENESSKHDHNMTIEHQDQASQPPTTEEEVSSLDTVMEENSEQLNSVETSLQSSGDQSKLYLKESKEEQTTQNQDLIKTENSIQEEQEYNSRVFTNGALNFKSSIQDAVRNQQEELNQLQRMEEYHPFEQHPDAITERSDQATQQPAMTTEELSSQDFVIVERPKQQTVLRKSTQSSDNQSIFHHTENNEEQTTQNQILELSTQRKNISVTQEQKSNQTYSEEFEAESKARNLIHSRIDNFTFKSSKKEKNTKEKRNTTTERNTHVKNERQGFLGAICHIAENISDIQPRTLKILSQFNSKSCEKDIYTTMLENDFNLTTIYKKINYVTFIERKNISHRELDKIFHSIEFNIIKDNVVVVNRKFGEKYSLDFVVKSVGSERGEKLLGIVTRGNSKNNKKIDPHITLFIDVSLGEKNGKGKIKYIESSTDGIESKYSLWRGQSRMLLVCKEDKGIPSHQLINEVLTWVKTQALDNIRNFNLSKLPRDQFLRVEEVSPDEPVFDIKKSGYRNATLYLDTKDLPSTAKRINFYYGTGKWEGAKSTSINLGDVVDELLRIEEDIRIHSSKILDMVGNVVKVGEENQKIILKVGSHYFGNDHYSKKFKIVPRTSIAGLSATMREYLLYRLLKSKYLAENVVEPKEMIKSKIVKEMDELSTKYNIPGEVGETNYRGRLRTLKALNLVRMDPNDKILRWMDISESIEDSYKYWISYLYRVGDKKSRQNYRPIMKNLIECNLSYVSVQGLELFDRRKTNRIPIKKWEIIIYNLDDKEIIKKLLDHKYRNFDSLPREKTLKNYIKNYIGSNPDGIQVIHDNKLSKIGYRLSKRYFVLHEYQDGKSQHAFLKKFDEVYQKKTGRSILGDEFNGYKLNVSEQESTKYVHTLYTSEDMYASCNGKDQVKIITKGSSINSNLGAHQLLELAVQKGKRIIIHIEYNPTSDLGSIYIGRLFDSHIKRGLMQKTRLFSQFHHEVWKKMRNRSAQEGYLSLDQEILDKVDVMVIYNQKNKYSGLIQRSWEDYKKELFSYFGKESIIKGIKKEAFDSWWKQIVRNNLVWFNRKFKP